MAKKKNAATSRAKTLAKARAKRWKENASPDGENENQASGSLPSPPSPPSPPSESSPSKNHPTPSPSVSDEDEPQDACILPRGPGSQSQALDDPDGLVKNLDGLALGVASDEKIVLEDPPEDTDDPEWSRSPQSLADPEGDEGLPPPESLAEGPDENVDENNKVKEMAASLNELYQTSLHGYGRHCICTLGEVVANRVRFMLGTLNLMIQKGWGLLDASSTAAIVFGRGEWAARQVRTWIRAYQGENKLPTSVYSSWNASVIEDEDLASAIRESLRSKGKYIQARDVLEFFGTPAALAFSHLIDAPPSIRTAQRWMHRMGYTWMKERRGQFADGHEREDVVEYRMKNYIPAWIKLEQRMRSWDSDGNEIPPILKEGERVVVVWFHDESTFYAHDRRLTRWVHESETAGIHKKGEGVSLMVADFISADYGWLRLGEGAIPNDARVVFRAGKARDGWFGTADVTRQLSRAMAIVKKRYPNEDHVFVFDNATIHSKLPETTPNVNKMTLGPSEKVGGDGIGPSGQKIKVKYAPAILPDGTIQQLYHPLDHPIEELRGTFKGMAQILAERGIQGARKLKLVCPSIDSQKGQGCLPGATSCCARRVMQNQPDFCSQKSILQIQAEAEGFSVIYLPKYHCELNPIEQCWGAAKRVYRDSPPSSSEADLKQNMLAALDSVKVEVIRRFAARSRRFVHAYRTGLSGVEAAWANKAFHGHRVLPEALMQTMDRPCS
ncbi:DDE family endonuclease [Rhizoctonia solani 123E]|uniref:DDE family endonuclease n=1 Tax=Rhizoctonia solani 123E TaxID=1423351 RepID=A0A074S4M0_9AGAM|nr:DDE family endonuclease [Rhizoctonia solani 123E]